MSVTFSAGNCAVGVGAFAGAESTVAAFGTLVTTGAVVEIGLVFFFGAGFDFLAADCAELSKLISEPNVSVLSISEPANNLARFDRMF
jgi:hypothetical protein